MLQNAKRRGPVALLPLLLLPLLVQVWLLVPSVASAHAQLIQSSPAAGALLDSPPDSIQIELSEAISLQFSSLNVYDRTRKEQPTGPVSLTPGRDNVLTAALPTALSPGTYTVVWRVVSAVDGHLTTASFAFRVRDTSTSGGTTQEEEAAPVAPDTTLQPEASAEAENPGPLRWLVRAIVLAGAIFLVGGVLFTVGVTGPSANEIGLRGDALAAVLRRRFGTICAITAAVVAVGLLLDLVAQVAVYSNSGPIEALGNTAQMWTLVTTTRYGFAWALKALAALAVLGIMLFIRAKSHGQNRIGPTAWDLGAAAGSFLLLGQSLSSHAAAAHEGVGGHGLGLPVPVLADWLHLATAALWVGGLGYMVLALFPGFRLAGYTPEERRAFLARAVPRFSRFAILSVVLLGGTGVYNLLIHSTSLSTIFGSNYGLVLAVKIGAYVVLVALGAINLLRLTPVLRARANSGAGVGSPVTITAPANTGPQRLLRNVRLEVALGVVALVCAGGLTLLPPPADESMAAAAAAPVTPAPTAVVAVAPTPIPTPAPATASSEVAGYTFSLTVAPSLEGDRLALDITRLGSALPLTDVGKVLFKITPQDIDAGSSAYTAVAEPGATADRQTWSMVEPVFTLDGGYTVVAIVERTESSDIKAGFRMDLNEGTLAIKPGRVIDVRVSTDPSPPISGTATLKLMLRDGEGKPVPGAKLTVSPLMPAHAHVEPTGEAQPLEGEPGSYTYNVNFVMTGPWLIVFNVEEPGQPPLKTDASIDVAGPPGTPEP